MFVLSLIAQGDGGIWIAIGVHKWSKSVGSSKLIVGMKVSGSYKDVKSCDHLMEDLASYAKILVDRASYVSLETSGQLRFTHAIAWIPYQSNQSIELDF